MQKNIALLVYYDCFDMLENALGGDDASFARAVRALIRYARTGEVPQALERTHPAAFFAFRMLQPKVDATLSSMEEVSEKRAEAGRRGRALQLERKAERDGSGGRTEENGQNGQAGQTPANAASYPNQSDPIQSDPSLTDPIQSKPFQSETEEDGGRRARKKAPARKAKESAASPAAEDPGFSPGIRETAKRLAARYLPPMRGKPEEDPRVFDLAEDLAEHGAERVEDALRRAKEGDNRGGVWITFYRAILRGAGPSGASPRAEKRPPDPGYLTRKYTEADFRAMEVDLDAEGSP